MDPKYLTAKLKGNGPISKTCFYYTRNKTRLVVKGYNIFGIKMASQKYK